MDIPVLQEHEKSEFNYRLSMCGAGLAKGPETEFRTWIPELKQNPSLEYRVWIENQRCRVLVRQADWENILKARRTAEREAGKRAFWNSFPKSAFLAVIFSISVGVVFTLFAFVGASIFGLKANYGHAFGCGAGIAGLYWVVTLIYQYSVAKVKLRN